MNRDVKRIKEVENGIEDKKDLTFFVGLAFREMMDEMICPYIIHRQGFFSRRAFFSPSFYLKNAGNVLGLFLGFSAARIMGFSAIEWYMIIGTSHSLYLGLAKSYFVDKYPLAQSVRMNLAFTSFFVMITVLIFVLSRL